MSFSLKNVKFFEDGTHTFEIYKYCRSFLNTSIIFEESLDIGENFELKLKQENNQSQCFQPIIAFNRIHDHKEVKVKIQARYKTSKGKLYDAQRSFSQTHTDYQKLISNNFVQLYSNGQNLEIVIKIKVRQPKININYTEIAEDLNWLLNNSHFSDFKFYVGKEEYFAHKAVLAARSPVFAAMFSNDFKESNSGESTINEFSCEAFLEFLHFIYTDSVKDITSHVIELLAIADQYEVKKLKSICEAELMDGLNEENAEDIFQYSHRYHCNENLKKASFSFIRRVFATSKFEIPESFFDSPDKLQEVVQIKNQLVKLLKEEQA